MGEASAHGGRPVVSVIIPSIRADRVEQALASVARQTWTGPLEAVVIHDGGPPLVLDRWPFGVVSLGGLARTGPAVARNRAVEASAGRILAFLDDDDEWCPDHLTLTVPAAEQTGGLVFTHAIVENVDEGWQRPLRLSFQPALLRRTNPVILSSLVMTRAAFASVGGFAADLPRYEDWDLLLRCQAHGIPFTQVPQATIRYRFSHRSTSADHARMAEVFALFSARHGLHGLPVTNFARMAVEGVPDG
ncbi:MAG: glycosyltransferase family 2 protein [Clostridia bacterium]